MSSRSNLFIVIEGIDGTGKSSVAPRVASLLASRGIEAVSCSTPMGIFESLRASFDVSSDSVAHYFYYLASVLHASAHIRELLADKSVVCDRYIYSTQAYHAVRGVEVLDIDGLGIKLPDAAFFLTATDDIRRTRLLARAKTQPWDIESSVPGSPFASIEAHLAELGLVEIETSEKSVDEVAEEIVNRVEQLP